MRTFVAIMKNKIYNTKVAHKICSFLLLFCLVFISLAQAFHHHENHNHNNKSVNGHFKQNFTKQISKTCQICKFILNNNQEKVLIANQYYNFKQTTNIELLHPKKYVAFYSHKHLSLFSGSSPPTT